MNLRLQYARPRNLEQTVALLDGLATGAMIIAGGQEIMPSINYGQLTPTVLVDIGALSELQGIEEVDGEISIGGLSVHRDIQSDPLILESAPLLAHAASQIGGGWQVHNRGSIAGNIVAMHSLYDIIPALLALQAKVEIASMAGTRTESVADLISSSSQRLGTSEVLTRVIIPTLETGHGWGYEKLKISEGSYGSANAAAIAVKDSDGSLTSLRLVVGAATDLPVDLSQALSEADLNAGIAELTATIKSACFDAISEPLSDQRGHGEYRRAMAGVVAYRAVSSAIDQTQESL